MRRTESLDRLNKPYLDSKHQSKKRSNRSKSRPTSARTYKNNNNNQHHQEYFQKSPSTARLLSIDPSFEYFDIPKHEGEVESYRKSHNIDFKGIVSGYYDDAKIQIPTKNKYKPTTTNSSVQVLKAPNIPITLSSSPFDEEITQQQQQQQNNNNNSNLGHICTCDDNNYGVGGGGDDNEDETVTSSASEAETVLHIPISRKGASPKKTENQINPSKIPSPPSITSTNFSDFGIESQLFPSSKLWSSTSTNDDTNKLNPLTCKASAEVLPFSLEQLGDWEAVFTRTYKDEQKFIQSSNQDHAKKLERLHFLYQSWIEDLYEQLDRFYDTFEDFQNATLDDRREFLQEINGLKDQLHQTQRDLWHEQGKVDYLEKKKREKVQKVTPTINDDGKKELLQEIKGLKDQLHSTQKQLVHEQSQVTCLEKENAKNIQIIQKLQETISGLKRVQESLEKSQRLDNKLLNDDKEISEQREQVRHALDQYKAKIFLKEKRLQKLNIEEHAMKLRIRAAASEEALLKSKINQMKGNSRGERPSTSTKGNKGRLDTGTGDDDALDHFWRNISSRADS